MLVMDTMSHHLGKPDVLPYSSTTSEINRSLAINIFFRYLDMLIPDKKMAIGKLFADDGAYEGNEIFRFLAENGIHPCIK
jgi:hypothetical protein